MSWVLGIFQFLFRCRHKHMSRVFTIKNRTYRSASIVVGNLTCQPRIRIGRCAPVHFWMPIGEGSPFCTESFWARWCPSPPRFLACELSCSDAQAWTCHAFCTDPKCEPRPLIRSSCCWSCSRLPGLGHDRVTKNRITSKQPISGLHPCVPPNLAANNDSTLGTL